MAFATATVPWSPLYSTGRILFSLKPLCTAASIDNAASASGFEHLQCGVRDVHANPVTLDHNDIESVGCHLIIEPGESGDDTDGTLCKQININMLSAHVEYFV